MTSECMYISLLANTLLRDTVRKCFLTNDPTKLLIITIVYQENIISMKLLTLKSQETNLLDLLLITTRALYLWFPIISILLQRKQCRHRGLLHEQSQTVLNSLQAEFYILLLFGIVFTWKLIMGWDEVEVRSHDQILLFLLRLYF